MDVTTLSATMLARFIRTHLISAVNVMDAVLSRLDRVNPQLNAVFQIDTDTARAQAVEADQALSRAEPVGPLHGVPITIKDSLDTEGRITTWGTVGKKSSVPSKDSTVVSRLRGAGAIILGKSNTPELTLSGITDNDVYGRTNNPYDLKRTPAGSSGGAAAIIAAGGSALDLGSDTGGSIRMPSHFCGIAGIKPTSGRVPRTGHAISYQAGALDAFTQIGPMARSVEDLILTLPIIQGPDGRDPAIVPVPLADPYDVTIKSLRIAYYTDNGIKSASQETSKTVKDAAALFSEHGASVVEARPHGATSAATLWRELYLADGGDWIRQLLRSAGTTKMSSALDWMKEAKSKSLAEFSRALSQWSMYRSDMLGFMDDYDLILCPVSATPATAHDDPEGPDFSYTFTHNLTGWPAATVRCDSSDHGLPIGVQLVARPWRDDIVLAAAQYIETNLGGWKSPPI